MSREFYHPVYTFLKKDGNLLPIKLVLVDSLLVKSCGLYSTVGSPTWVDGSSSACQEVQCYSVEVSDVGSSLLGLTPNGRVKKRLAFNDVMQA